jgi:hypothetical protein
MGDVRITPEFNEMRAAYDAARIKFDDETPEELRAKQADLEALKLKMQQAKQPPSGRPPNQPTNPTPGRQNPGGGYQPPVTHPQQPPVPTNPTPQPHEAPAKDKEPDEHEGEDKEEEGTAA